MFKFFMSLLKNKSSYFLLLDFQEWVLDLGEPHKHIFERLDLFVVKCLPFLRRFNLRLQINFWFVITFNISNEFS